MSITAVPLKPVKRGVLVYLWLAIALAVVLAVALAFRTPIDPSASFLSHNARTAGVFTTASGLQYQVLAPGKGPTATDEDEVLILYEGRLLNGTVFDKSVQPTPLEVPGVVPGFSEALKLMNKGGKYRIWLKPSLGYADHPPAGSPILPNSTLVFDVELLDMMPILKFRQMQQALQQQQMMQQQQGGGAGGMPQGAGGLPPGIGGPPPGR